MMGDYSVKQKHILEEKSMFEKNKEVFVDLSEIMRIYKEFKYLRKALGKPVTDKLDPIKIRRDLSSKDFFS